MSAGHIISQPNSVWVAIWFEAFRRGNQRKWSVSLHVALAIDTSIKLGDSETRTHGAGGMMIMS